MVSVTKFRTIVGKALALNSQPTEESFPELPDVLVWFRFVLGLSYGAFLGYKGVSSGVFMLQALNLITFIPMAYCNFYLRTPKGQFESKILFAGLLNALALCLLVWIYFYTAANQNEEVRFASLLMSSSTSDVSTDATTDDAVEGPDGSEF